VTLPSRNSSWPFPVLLAFILSSCGGAFPRRYPVDAGSKSAVDAPVPSPSVDADGPTDGPEDTEPREEAGLAAVDQGSPCSSPDCGDASPCVVDAPSNVWATLQSYGGGSGFASVVGFPADDRVLFLSGKLLTLTKVVGDALEELDHIQWGSQPSTYQIGPMTWAYRPTVFILPLASKRAAVIGADWSIDVFDISQDRLSVLYRYGFGSGGQRMMNAAVSRGNDIWTCDANYLRRYWLDDREGRIRQDSPVTLPARHDCHGLALAPDGRSLFAATMHGIDLVDISAGDGTGTLLRTALPDSPIVDVAAGSSAVAAYQLESNDSGVGTIMLLDASDFSVLSSHPPTDSHIAAGTTILPSGLVLEEEWDFANCHQVTAQTYGIASGVVNPLAQYLPMSACRGDFSLPPVVIASGGQLVDLPPVHQVVRVDPITGAMHPLRGRHQGSFDRVMDAGPGLVEVHGPTSMHLVDISNPTAPVIREGGLLAPMTAERLAVEITSKGEAVMLTVPSSDTPPTGPRTSLFWQREGGLPVLAGSIANPDPEAQWFAAGGYLVGVAMAGDTDYGVRRLSVASLHQTEDQVVSPDLAQTVPGPTSSGMPRRLGFKVAVDAKSGDCVVAERRAGSASSGLVFAWYAPDEAGYRMAGSASLPQDLSLVDLGIAAGRALLLLEDRLLLLDRTGAILATDNSSDSSAMTKLLSFDEREVYLAAMLPARDQPSIHAVLVRRAADLSIVGRYSLPDAALSTARAGNLRIFGTKSTLIVSTPATAPGAR
jgi:hypothetical protein